MIIVLEDVSFKEYETVIVEHEIPACAIFQLGPYIIHTDEALFRLESFSEIFSVHLSREEILLLLCFLCPKYHQIKLLQ